LPKDQFSPGNPFYPIESNDGFHVVQTECGPILTLSVLAYYGGVPCNIVDKDPANTTVEIMEYTKPTAQARGECERLRLVMDAVCRYFTTGGSWGELANSLQLARTIIKGGIVFPGYYLTESYSTTDGTYQHSSPHFGQSIAHLKVRKTVFVSIIRTKFLS